MAIKGCKSIAEFYFRKWMEEEGLLEDSFSLYVTGSRAVIKDGNGDTLPIEYDREGKRVRIRD